MGKPNQAARSKRDRERSRQEWRAGKEERRASKDDTKTERERLIAEGIDPDLVGIVAGPQPIEPS